MRTRCDLPWQQRREIEPVTDCWLFTGPTNNKGYGRAKNTYVHRLSYIEAHGAIPPGREIDHLCKNRRCFNPKHLDAVTHTENVKRSARPVSLTHCPSGHEFATLGFYMSDSRKRCRQCRRLRDSPTFRPVDPQEVVRLLAEGLKQGDIGARIGRSRRTVSFILKKARAK